MGILCGGLTTAKGEFTVFTLRLPTFAPRALRTLVRVAGNICRRAKSRTLKFLSTPSQRRFGVCQVCSLFHCPPQIFRCHFHDVRFLTVGFVTSVLFQNNIIKQQPEVSHSDDYDPRTQCKLFSIVHCSPQQIWFFHGKINDRLNFCFDAVNNSLIIYSPLTAGVMNRTTIHLRWRRLRAKAAAKGK